MFASRASALQGGAHQVPELIVADIGSGLRPQTERPLAGLQLGMASGEAGVAALVPALDGDAVPPGADKEAALA